MKIRLVKIWKKIKIYMIKSNDIDAAGDLLMSKFVSKNKKDIAVNDFGKPYLKSKKFWFNLTHTTGYAAIAISPDNEVGLDIERLDRKIDYKALIMSRFNLQLYSHSKTNEEFIKQWAIKESAIKCYGNLTLNSIYRIKTNDNLSILKCENKNDLEYHVFYHDNICFCITKTVK